MAAIMEPNLCSICDKSSGKYFCTGCKNYFCPKDFKEHEQNLAIRFDNEIVRLHNELLNRIHKLENSNHSSLELFAQIEQWKTVTLDKVEKAAEGARRALTELIDQQRIRLKKQLEPMTIEIQSRREEENFVEHDIDRLQLRLNEIHGTLEKFTGKDATRSIVIGNDEVDWNRMIYIREEKQNLKPVRNIILNSKSKWIQNPIIIAGRNGKGNDINQLSSPYGLCVDDNQTVYIIDRYNHRVLEWKCNAATNLALTVKNGQENCREQLSSPIDIILDKGRNSLIISDYNLKKVIRWSLQSNENSEILLSDIGCYGLALDNDGFLYVAEIDKDEIRKYRLGDNQGTIVAGGNGRGNRLDQLSCPTFIYVDRDQSVYVSDRDNHRVLKWLKGAKQGIVVAGGKGQGNSLSQLSNPRGIYVDQAGNLYVADTSNHRVVRWVAGATYGSIIVGGTGERNQLSSPVNLSFDLDGNLYVSDCKNDRVYKFSIDRN